MDVTKMGTAMVSTMPEKIPRMVFRSPDVRIMAGKQVSLAAPAAESGPRPPKTRANRGANSKVKNYMNILEIRTIEPNLKSTRLLMRIL